jgi:hypothetical protein
MAVSTSTSASTSTTSRDSGCAFIIEHCCGQARLFNNHATRTLSRKPGDLTSIGYLYELDETGSWNATLFGGADDEYRASPPAAFVQASCIYECNWSWRSLLENKQSIGKHITRSTSDLGTRHAPTWSPSRTSPGFFAISECEWGVRKIFEASTHTGHST